MAQPRALILAGPNGAGKTTFAREFLTAEGHCPTFINADLIAAGLSPFDPDLAVAKAMRLMMERVQQAVDEGEDFAVESTLAGRSYQGHLKHWQSLGFRAKVVFLRLPSADLAVERVRFRVAQGGHNIPEDVIRRRFDRGWMNFASFFMAEADTWQLFDASSCPARLIDEGGQQW